jgi:hypothetical protein
MGSTVIVPTSLAPRSPSDSLQIGAYCLAHAIRNSINGSWVLRVGPAPDALEKFAQSLGPPVAGTDIPNVKSCKEWIEKG